VVSASRRIVVCSLCYNCRINIRSFQQEKGLTSQTNDDTVKCFNISKQLHSNVSHISNATTPFSTCHDKWKMSIRNPLKCHCL